MPRFNVETTQSEQIWASPDGQRVIYKVTLTYNGKPVSAKTYSKAISQVGWSGEVEMYEKVGKNGAESFVKQPPKEDGGYPQRGSGISTKGSGGDQFTMYLSYAKDLAVAMLATKEGFDEGKYGELLGAVSAGGESLYDAHNKPSEPAKDVVVTEIEPALEQLNAVFKDAEAVVDGEDTPWPTK